MSEDPTGTSSEPQATHPRSAIQEQPSTRARRVRAATDRDRHPLWDSVWHTSRPEECWRSYRYRRDPSAPMSTTASAYRLLCTMSDMPDTACTTSRTECTLHSTGSCDGTLSLYRTKKNLHMYRDTPTVYSGHRNRLCSLFLLFCSPACLQNLRS